MRGFRFWNSAVSEVEDFPTYQKTLQLPKPIPLTLKMQMATAVAGLLKCFEVLNTQRRLFMKSKAVRWHLHLSSHKFGRDSRHYITYLCRERGIYQWVGWFSTMPILSIVIYLKTNLRPVCWASCSFNNLTHQWKCSRYSDWLPGWLRGQSSSPSRVKNFIRIIQTSPGVHPTLYPMDTGGSFRGGKAAVACRWPLTSS
jgi:hypothetical protein